MRRVAAIVVSVLAISVTVADELDIARQAMRDGLYEVAAIHADKAGGIAGAELKVASLACRGEWKQALAEADLAISSGGVTDSIQYHRALALDGLGDGASAMEALSAHEFRDRAYATLARRLKVRIAMKTSGAEPALEIMKSDGPADDPDDLLLAAALTADLGDREGAAGIFRSVIAAGMETDATAFVRAAVALGDIAAMKKAYESDIDPVARRIAGFGYARKLLGGRDTIDEGARIIRELVSVNPDTDGAKDHFTAIASAYVDFGDPARAEAILDEAVKSWPELDTDRNFRYTKAWAEYGLGKYRDAIASFRLAEGAAEDATVKATCAATIGDILLLTGKAADADAEYRRAMENYGDTDIASRIADSIKLADAECRARELYAEYRFDEAQQRFAEIAAEFPSAAARMDMLSVYCMYGRGYDEDARRKATELIDSSDSGEVRSSAMVFLAKLACNRGDWKEAARRFGEFLAEAHDDDGAVRDVMIWSADAMYLSGDYKSAITRVSEFAGRFAGDRRLTKALTIQSRALIELARFDEAVLVLEKALASADETENTLPVRMLLGDSLYAMGSDDARRFTEALAVYREALADAGCTPEAKLILRYKSAKALDQMRRLDEAVDEYYSGVVLAFREQRENGVAFDDEAVTAFVRSAFRLSSIFEDRGQNYQAMKILELVLTSGVSAAEEAGRRIDELKRKGVLP